MAAKGLCPEHRAKPPQEAQEVIHLIQRCCGHQPLFLSPKLPLMESLFRLLLARGNQPLSSQELAAELTACRTQKVDEELVAGLLRAEPRYYGVRPVVEEEPQ